MQTNFTQKDSSNRISVGRVTPPDMNPGIGCRDGCPGPCAPSFRVCGGSGFTLTELLVVIATLALLAALILPALSQGLDRDTSIKVQCANQLRQLGMAMTVLAGENTGRIPGVTNGGYYLPARGGNGYANERAINDTQAFPDDFLGPSATNGINKIWCCPSLPDHGQPDGLPVYQSSQGQWLVGYSYYGGIQYWVNSAFPGGTPSYSPVTLSQAHPAWVLLADCMNGYRNGYPAIVSWEIGVNFLSVPHRRAGTTFPDGGNECFVDGSVTWVKLESTLQLTEFSATYSHDYMYQSELPPAFTPTIIKTLAPPY